MPDTPGDVKSTTWLKIYKRELRQAYEKEVLYKVCLAFFVSDNLQKKIMGIASNKPPQGKLVTTESIGWAIKKVPGLTPNLLNDTNQSGFLAWKVISLCERMRLPDAQ